MNLHEYQAKSLFARYGIPVPNGQVVESVSAAIRAVESLGGTRWVVKAQVHAGGRGKVGGVQLVNNVQETARAAEDLLSRRLVTKQTDASGLPIHKLLIESAQNISQELYLSVVTDRKKERITFMSSAAGGMDIEEVAETTPEQIFTITVHPACGLQDYHGRLLGFALGMNKAQVQELTAIMQGLYRLCIENDTSLVELNPLIIMDDGGLLALDAKINVDDNALSRQKELASWRDPTQEDPEEYKASQHDLNYIRLNGNIGCMVNGAGLAMATMDLVQLHGGAPANFLDVGGGATAERVTEAFKLILSSSEIRAILVNIFGGIVRCDLIAEGIIAAMKEVDISIPVIVRLEGTNVDQGKKMLAESGFDLIIANDLTDAAQKAVASARNN